LSSDNRPLELSQALLSAALSGLLGVVPACHSASTEATASDDTTGTVVSPDTPIPDTTCDGGVVPSPQVTSATAGAVAQADFESECADKGGIFEVQPNCGGSNACRGMSYDSATQTLTEHTCRATNSCAGFSCVVCD